MSDAHPLGISVGVRFDVHCNTCLSERGDLLLASEGSDRTVGAFTSVRRQNIWDCFGLSLVEGRFHLGVDIKRRVSGVASADFRWSFV